MESGVRVRYSNGQEAVFDNQIAIRHAQSNPSESAPFARLGDCRRSPWERDSVHGLGMNRYTAVGDFRSGAGVNVWMPGLCAALWAGIR